MMNETACPKHGTALVVQRNERGRVPIYNATWGWCLTCRELYPLARVPIYDPILERLSRPRRIPRAVGFLEPKVSIRRGE